MSTILVAIIIIAIAVIPTSIFMRLHKRREKKRFATLRVHFKKTGAKHGLSFTHEEILKDKMLGFDTNNQTLVVYAFDAPHNEIIADLTNVEDCTIYKEYYHTGDANAGLVLTQMGLKIVFSNTTPSLAIDFFCNQSNVTYELPELEKKAKEWQKLIAQKSSRKFVQGKRH